MSFARVLEQAHAEVRLFSALLELTYRCNLDCAFCYNDVGLEGAPLSRAQWEGLLEELAGMGALYVTLSGGEPLAHPDFFALGARGRELGFAVQVKTNGHALRGAVARRLRAEVDPFLVEVSLHGATAATHDRQTRVPGSFERLLRNLREAREEGLRIRLNATLTLWNEGEVEAMYDLAEAVGLPLQFDPEVSPRDDGDRGPLGLSASREGLLRLFEVQRARSERTGRPEPVPGAEPEDEAGRAPLGEKRFCGAGSSAVTVDPFGNVYPCVQWRVPSGSLHRQSLREIWSGSPALRDVRGATARLSREMEAAGPGARLMGFCPGAAATATGSPLAVYPAAALRAELRREAASNELPAYPAPR